MAIDNLLNKLQRVKQTGKGRWLASCPTRDDKTPSMTIRELDDGRILIHDFGGSSTNEILEALGLSFADLFPQHLTHHSKPERRPFPASDLLKVIAFEALICVMGATRAASGQPIDETDRTRLLLAASRIRDALHAGGLQP
jgi:hypothetical protein